MRIRRGKIKTSYGIGTSLTASIPGYRALNVVMKLHKVNGRPVAKISDAPGKSVGDNPEFVGYLRTVFNVAPQPAAVEFSPEIARLRDAYLRAE